MKTKSRVAAPYVQAAHQGRRQRPSLIVLRSIDVISYPGNAFHVANWWHNPACSKDVVTHYVMDESETYLCVPTTTQAGTCERGSIAITLCSPPTDEHEWYRIVNSGLFDNTIELVTDLCLKHGIRPRAISFDEHISWRKFKTKLRGGIRFETQGGMPEGVFIRVLQRRIDERKKEK